MKQPILFFGDRYNAVPAAVLHGDNALALLKANDLAVIHNLKKLLFPLQVHGTKGLVIHNEHSVASFTHEADWVITNQPGIAIGVLTADCVPILIYDPVHNVVGAIHAGWRGAVDGVVIEALQAMQKEFGSQPAELQASIGPHARTCCYQVDQPFYDTVVQKKFGAHAWHTAGEKLFFDLTQCCVDQLIDCGVKKQHISDNGVCTICEPAYSSYRREKEAALRNISFIGIL
jgi:YfiH family protein